MPQNEQTETSDLLSLRDATKRVPPVNGRRVHPSCVWRWARRGLKARNGEIVRLRHVRVGARVCVRLAWINEFFQALADADTGEPVEAPRPMRRQGRSAKERERAIQRAKSELESAAVK